MTTSISGIGVGASVICTIPLSGSLSPTRIVGAVSLAPRDWSLAISQRRWRSLCIPCVSDPADARRTGTRICSFSKKLYSRGYIHRQRIYVVKIIHAGYCVIRRTRGDSWNDAEFSIRIQRFSFIMFLTCWDFVYLNGDVRSKDEYEVCVRWLF